MPAPIAPDSMIGVQDARFPELLDEPLRDRRRRRAGDVLSDQDRGRIAAHDQAQRVEIAST
jgi:hypothetical protein